MFCVSKASKTHKHTDACRPKIFQNLRKILPFEHKTCKTGTFSYFWPNLTKVFSNIIYLFKPFQCITLGKILRRYIQPRKKITFIRSVCQIQHSKDNSQAFPFISTFLDNHLALLVILIYHSSVRKVTKDGKHVYPVRRCIQDL